MRTPRRAEGPSQPPQDTSYQSLGARLVTSTYSPHMHASPPITRAFCSGLPARGHSFQVIGCCKTTVHLPAPHRGTATEAGIFSSGSPSFKPWGTES